MFRTRYSRPNNKAQYEVGLTTSQAHVHSKAQIGSYNWVSISSCMVLHQSGAMANKLGPAYLSSSSGRSELSSNIAELIPISSQLPPYINRCPIIGFKYTFSPQLFTSCTHWLERRSPCRYSPPSPWNPSFKKSRHSIEAVWSPNLSSDL